MGFTITEVSFFLENSNNDEILLDLLKRKSVGIEENIKREELKLENIKSISIKFSEKASKDSQKQNEKDNDKEVSYEVNGKITTLDSCTSIERHTLEEVIWL